MIKEPIFLSPFFQERIWGGNKLSTLFGYDIPNQHTGEAWVISAHQHGQSKVKSGAYKGKSLRQLWEEHPELFGKKTTSGQEFPLLVKILDANDDLSIQVHPDDQYARDVEGVMYGKTECWYVLDCEEGAEIVFGHNASNPTEFKEMADRGEWNHLLNRVKVKKGDFFFVPSGTIHAIGKGIVILETQQSSDTTYRVYDYDRVDAKGVKRELHLDKAIEVTRYQDLGEPPVRIEKRVEDLNQTQLVKSQYFSVYYWNLTGAVHQPIVADYLLVSVIKGKGELVIGDQTYTFAKGDHFILPATVDRYVLKGQAEFIVSHE
ncbi:mannose-6-phosphate isomerase, class I [Cytobacillus sp. Hz8]|uniref:mannose-6-phosphate isomerase, class I n=1 Tax=Cytobacillus sp. Hz8 TaxID=3347168 RepID=UPI0035DCCB91